MADEKIIQVILDEVKESKRYAREAADASHKNTATLGIHGVLLDGISKHLENVNGSVADHEETLRELVVDVAVMKNGTGKTTSKPEEKPSTEKKINPFVDFALVAGKEAVKTKFGRWMLFMGVCWVITSCGGCYTLAIEFVNFIGTK